LSTLPPQQQPPGQVVIQLQGQPAVRYVIQTSTDLGSGNWTSISTNTLSSGTLNLTNTASSGQHFYRAVWQP
jgi:O-acetyl-ADP-ribose deacetylase (regulator of RNase III)